MTARPIFADNRKRPVQAAVALVLVMATVLLSAGCIDGKNVREPENETVRLSLSSAIAATEGHSGIAEINTSILTNPVMRNSTCPNTPYEPVLLLGDTYMTRILGHETKSVNSSRTFCTEFDPGQYTISFNIIPYHVMKFDFAEFDQSLIISRIRQDQEIDVWIRGEKHKVLFKEMNFFSENIGTHSYSGLLDGISRNKVILTIGKNVTSGSVIWGGETFYITPVGIKKDAAGNTSPVSIIYDQRDVEEYRIDLSNDVITPPITLVHYEST